MIISFQQLINNAIKEKKKGRERKEQTSWYISEIGSCMRGQYLKRLGVKSPIEITDRELRVFDVGDKTEEWIIELLKKQNEFKVSPQVRVEDKELNISGYVDVILEKDKEQKPFEIKSKHSRSFWYMEKKGEGAMLQHKYQLWTYLYLLKLKEGSIVYVSKDDLTIIEFPIYLEDKELKKDVLSYLELMNKAWKEKNPLLLPLPEKDLWQAKYCRFHEYCTKLDDNPNLLDELIYEPKRNKI